MKVRKCQNNVCYEVHCFIVILIYEVLTISTTTEIRLNKKNKVGLNAK